MSGLYIIKELCHQFDSSGSFTKLKLIRDTFEINMLEDSILKVIL